jgi:hypothetical protein
MIKTLHQVLLIFLVGVEPTLAGQVDFTKAKDANIYKDLPGVETPPPVTTLGSKAKNCVTVQMYEFNKYTGRRMPALGYQCSDGDLNFLSTMPPVQ